MSKIARIGVIGAGWWAVANHLPQLRDNPEAEVVSISGVDEEALSRIQQSFGIPHRDLDWRKLLERELDAVIVATPNHLHYEHTIAALNKNLHVLCEKPMALTPGHAWQMVDTARVRGRHLLLPYGWHYKPFIQRAKRLLEERPIGDIQHVLCHMASPTRPLFAGKVEKGGDWSTDLVTANAQTWQNAAMGGGYTYGQMTHSTALLFWLTGLRARKVTAMMASPDADVDLYCAGSVVFENGATGAFSGAATLPDHTKYQVDIRVFGSDGILLLDVERERMEIRYHDGSVASTEITPEEGAYSCEGPVARFIDLILGREVTNDSPGDVGARSTELLWAFHASAASGSAAVSVE